NTPNRTATNTPTNTPTRTPTETPTPTFPPTLAACRLGWPTPNFTGCALGPTRGPTPFNENGTLKAVRPVGAAPAGAPSINLFYGDEPALTLGASKFGVNTCSVQPTPVKTPACVSSPAIGCTMATDPANRPIFPSLFLTDITNDFGSRAGDWQCGGTPLV